MVLLLGMKCKNPEDKIEEQEKKNLQNLLLLVAVRETGECLRIETISSTVKKLTCTKNPIGLCNSEELLYTQAERNKRISTFNSYIDRFPICKSPILLSGLLSVAITSSLDTEKINSNNRYEFISSCESLGFTSNTPVLQKEEIRFYQSDRGKLGIYLDSQAAQTPSLFVPQSSISEAKECLDSVFTPDEKLILEAVRLGKKISSYSCQTGNTSNSPCDRSW
jgi:hypothetical protein